MKEVLERLQKANQEQAALLRQLRMWSKVQAQGIDPETVATFGFDPNLMSFKEKHECRRRFRGEGVGMNCNPYNFPIVDGKFRPTRYNYVNLKNGQRIKLEPAIEAPEYE